MRQRMPSQRILDYCHVAGVHAGVEGVHRVRELVVLVAQQLFPPRRVVGRAGHEIPVPDPLVGPIDGPTVAVTHFAPSLRSADPRYGLAPGTAGFCNSLDELIPMADLWIHGHTHTAFDYEVRGTRVVSNPRGYEHETTGFSPDRVLTL